MEIDGTYHLFLQWVTLLRWNQLRLMFKENYDAQLNNMANEFGIDGSF